MLVWPSSREPQDEVECALVIQMAGTHAAAMAVLAVIFALGGDIVPLVGRATQTIPIVYAMSADPVQLGVADSLGKPGGNATGVTFLSDELAAKAVGVVAARWFERFRRQST